MRSALSLAVAVMVLLGIVYAASHFRKPAAAPKPAPVEVKIPTMVCAFANPQVFICSPAEEEKPPEEKPS